VFFRKNPGIIEYPPASGLFVQAGNYPDFGPEIGNTEMNGRDAGSLNSYALGVLRNATKPDTTGKGTIEIKVNPETNEAIWPTSIANHGLARFGFDDGEYIDLQIQRLTWIIDARPRIEVEAGAFLNLSTDEQTALAIQSMKERIRYA
jgi:hypothetical protein